MGQKKSVTDESKNKMLEEFAEILRNIQTHYMNFMITTTKQDDADWKATGNLKIGSSLDGEHWGEVEMAVVGYDKDSDSALATVMVALNNYINSPEFVSEMGNRIKKSLEEEPKVPEIYSQSI